MIGATVRAVIVLGAGVCGLTTATVLAETGHAVQVLAAALSPNTTSNVAAAFWYPYRTLPSKRSVRRAITSYRQFAQLCSVPQAGVSMRRAFDFSRHRLPRPWWAEAVRGLVPVEPMDAPPGFEHGWCFDAPVIDTRAYLPYLMQRFRDAGGSVETHRVESFTDLPGTDPVINCCGLGARTLCDDTALHPIRGQLVHVDNPGLEHVLLDEHDGGGIAYAVPRGDHIVLGGTAIEHDDDLRVRPDETDAIVNRCAELDPRLRAAARLDVVVGLRPGRHDVRLERDPAADRVIIHNYGHGGAGVTLSWGCAHEVRGLLESQ
ncbi:MAG: FAD-binding oxidoreductase [Nannocystaceae bacterium]|nr:FAD-binding oxidoreductase [Nannocystaceae bacterium]